MPIFHLHSQHIGRSGGRSAVAAAAYRSASLLVEEIVDKSTGLVFEQVHDYRNKEGVFFSEIFAPDRCALWMKDREMLWNFVQNKFETRKNSVFSQEIDLALPVEFSRGQNLELLKEFIFDTFVKEGVIVDTNIHYDNPENPHAHLMLSTREIVWNEEVQDYTFGNKVRFWDTKEFLVQVRRSWARYINDHLEKHGFDMEVSHLSYKEQGIDLLPGIKEGIGRRVEGSDRAALNKEIRAVNTERLLENPELVIDRLRKERAVFTKEDIARELFSAYQEVRGGELVLRLEDGSEHSDGRVDYNDAETSKFVCDLAKVMSSDRLVNLGTKDLEGRPLYTSRVRFELEQDLLAKVGAIKASSELMLEGAPGLASISLGKHYLDVALEDLEKKTVFESVKDKAAAPLETLGILRKSSVLLSDKQKGVVLGVLSGQDVSVVEGLPGAGKTTVMREVARQYKKAGYDVIGAAVSASAASELGMVAGIKSMSITKLRYEIEQMRGRDKDDFKPSLRMDYWKSGESGEDAIYGGSSSSASERGLLSDKTVLIVDEASMVDLTEMHFIVSEVERAGAKLVLLGDRGQLSSVGIVGSFEMMAEHFSPLILDEVRRQSIEEHQEATKLLSQYKVADAIEIYRNTGVFKFSGLLDEARDALICDFAAEYIKSENAADTNMVALSYSNEEVCVLNHGIREKLKESGVIYGPEVEFENRKFGKLKFAAGDKVVFGENDKWLGVFNGDTGKVIGFGKSKDGTRDVVRVRLDNTENVLGIDVPNIIEIDNHYYKSMEHGFAVNIYKSQGRTYDKVYALIDGYIGFHSFNVLATRHKEYLRIYVGDDILEGVLYKKISLDEGSARDTWDIRGGKQDPDSKRYAGLVALCQRRDNRSLSEDWKVFAAKPEFGILNDYVEARSEVIRLSKEIDEWGALQNLRGALVKASEHEMYGTLQGELARRKSLAAKICDNYSSFGKLITASGINYNTLEKHAGRVQYKYFFERKNSAFKSGVLSELEGFADVIRLTREFRSCDVGPLFENSNLSETRALEIAAKIAKLTGSMIEGFDERVSDIEAARLNVEDAKCEKLEAQNFVRDATEYTESSIKSFLSKTYKERPEVILERWASFRDKALEKDGTIDSAIAGLKKDPQILGALKGIGIGSFLAFSKDRFRATVNMYEVGERIEKFEDYREKLPVVTEDLKNGKYDERIFEFVAQVSLLEKSSAFREVDGFVREMHAVMRKLHLSAYQERDIQNALSWAKNSINAAKIDFYHEILEDKSGELARKYERQEKASRVSRQATGYTGFSFDEVARSLTPSHFEEIFRVYANVINPDGKPRKNGLRIMSGSLGMDLKTGLWHRFSSGDGGNIFGFVREARGGDIVDALEAVAGHAGLQPKAYDISRSTPDESKLTPEIPIEKPKSPANEWIPYDVVLSDAPEFDPSEHLKHMTRQNTFGGLYTYRESQGEVIGHTIRLVSKENGSKQVLPVAYCQNPALGESAWRLKGFETYDASNNKYKPIYGTEKLYAEGYKDRPILIVEGEKTADKAQELFPEYTVISWLGGTFAATRVNWGVLQGRQVLIWPDNDAVGKVAARVIADRINGKAGAISGCAIIDPSNLEFGSKVHEDILPEKWDLADEIPKGITISDLNEVLENAYLRARSLDKAEMLASRQEDEAAILAIWQNRSAGMHLSQKDASVIASSTKALDKILSSKEALGFVEYAKVRGISESSHEFLSLKNPLYRDSLVQIAIACKSLTIDLKVKNAEIPELLRDVQNSYEQKRDSFTDHIDCSRSYANVLASTSSDKGELMQILTRDVLLLHKMQLESGQLLASSSGSMLEGQKIQIYRTILSDAHKEKVVQDIYDVIKSHRVGGRPQRSDSNKLSDEDKVAIAGIVYEKLNSSDWWKELAQTRLEIGNKTKDLVSQPVDSLQNDIFKEIEEFDPKYDIGGLKERMGDLKESLKHDVLHAELNRIFNLCVSPKLDAFALAKSKAKNVNGLLRIMDKEREYCSKIYKQHTNAVLQNDDKHIASIALYYQKESDALRYMKQDAENINKFGINLSDKEFEKLRYTTSHEMVADSLFKHAQGHMIERISKNIDYIWNEKQVRVDGKKFTDVFAYTKYEVEEKNMGRYLKGTEIHQGYVDIKEYCKENHISEMQYIKSRSMSRGIEK